MMQTMKTFILTVALVLGSLGAWAATPGVTFLFSNGEKVSFAFASKPEIAVTDDGLSVSSSNAAAVVYQVADVQKFYFEDDVVETGISQVDGGVSAQHPVFNYADGVVSVNGMAAGGSLVVSSVSGSQVGAATAADYGDYYAWGETATKTDYSWSTYKYGTSYGNMTKYNDTDGKTVLDKEDDAAYVNWGSSCRMPTNDEFTELRNSSNCTWTWTKQTTSSGSSIYGYKVTCVKNGNSIFLPA